MRTIARVIAHRRAEFVPQWACAIPAPLSGVFLFDWLCSNRLAFFRGFLDSINDAHIRQPFQSIRLWLFIVQNTFGKVGQLWSELIAFFVSHIFR